MDPASVKHSSPSLLRETPKYLLSHLLRWGCKFKWLFHIFVVFFFFFLAVDRESFFIDIIHSKMGVYQHFLSVIVMVLQLFINDWFKKPVSSVSQVRVNSGNQSSRSQTLSLQSVSSHYLSHDKENAADCVVLWMLVFHCPRPMRGYPSQLLTSQTLLDS